MDKSPIDKLPDLDELFALYDRAAQQLLEVAYQDGHFPDSRPEALVWPSSGTQAAPISLDGLEERAQLIAHIYQGIPSRRDKRLAEAHSRFQQTKPAYHQANCTYQQLRAQFLKRRAGDPRDFLNLYQSVYLKALSREDPFTLDAGETALINLKVARPPLSHAQAVAEKLPQAEATDPRLSDFYTTPKADKRPLGTILTEIAEAVVDFMAAGEHLAIRYNTFNNFIFFGISIWKAITDLELLAARMAKAAPQKAHQRLLQYIRLGQGLLLKFLQAHLEDPAQIRPKEYWYGQEYSYLTRDMIDLCSTLIQKANTLRNRLTRLGRLKEVAPIEIPALLTNQVSGHFMEYQHVGRQRSLPGWQRSIRVLKWVRLFRQASRFRLKVRQKGLAEDQRVAAAWRYSLEWSHKTLKLFEVEVKVKVDPAFAAVAAALELDRGDRPIVFFPTHQSLLDHPVMYQVLQAPELLAAMGWSEPKPCSKLARARLMGPTSLKLGSKEIPLIGVDPQTADDLLEEVDGYVILQHSQDTGSPTRRFAKLLDHRPGVVYGAGTTSAFDLQILPMQHALFAQLPANTVFIPMAFRGIHALWPKCPRNNVNVNPGLVEVVVSPPMPGETTLLPRKRALRTQLEPATLFQAVHIADLLNPEASGPVQ